MDKRKYDDIINLPYKKSTSRKHMPISDRAAQFAPFSALTGYDDAVEETARITEDKIEIDNDTKLKLNERLNYIIENLNLEYKITYFEKDEKKSGGKYITLKNRIKKLNISQRVIILCDNTTIPIDNIFKIENEIFDKFNI